MRFLLTVLALLSVGVPGLSYRFAATPESLVDPATYATGPFAPPVLAITGVIVTLAMFLVTRRGEA